MDVFLLEHCGDGTNLLGAYGSRQAAEDTLRELPQDERYTVTEVPVDRRIGPGLTDNMGSLNHWHYLGCAECRDDAAPAKKPCLGGCYRDGVAYCLAYDANGEVELDGPTFTSLHREIDGGAAAALRKHMSCPPGELPRFVVALRLERVALRPEQVGDQPANRVTGPETEVAQPGPGTLADQVRGLCRTVMERASHVRIRRGNVERLGKSLTAREDPRRPPASREEAERLLFRELAANAVNYCYWFGRHDIKPGGGTSEMYRLLDASVADASRAASAKDSLEEFVGGIDVAAALEGFAARLRDQRFPLCDRRAAHLRELAGCCGWVRRWARRLMSGTPADDFLRGVIAKFPGYADDMFLKRAFLLATELHRSAGWFGPDMRGMPIPADYQIPKVLRHLGHLVYSDKLAAAVDSSVQIPRGSAMECEIRAASILACDMIAEAAGANPCDVDSLLFHSRKSCGDPFHLTVTTDY